MLLLFFALILRVYIYLVSLRNKELASELPTVWMVLWHCVTSRGRSLLNILRLGVLE